MRRNVLGGPVDILSKAKSIKTIASYVKRDFDEMRLVVTAYSEFYVRAQNDEEFMKILKNAELVTPDGVSVLAAAKYLERTQELNNSRTLKSMVKKLGEGLRVGGEILTNKVGETVTGVWLFEELTKMAADKGWKIFLLGGRDSVSARTAKMLLKRFPRLKIEYDSGETRVGTNEKRNTEIIEKINRFRPDILFVAYDYIKQYKWLARNRDRLKVKVGMGVGGTFDEYSGNLKKSPRWMERAGLKWLWRVLIEPKRIGRIMRAVIIFPWLVFIKSDK